MNNSNTNNNNQVLGDDTNVQDNDIEMNDFWKYSYFKCSNVQMFKLGYRFSQTKGGFCKCEGFKQMGYHVTEGCWGWNLINWLLNILIVAW